MATMTGISLETDKGLTECSICRETYKEPKLLPCIHTFCRHCIESHCKDKRPEEIPCPLCGNAFSLPPGGVKELSENTFIKRLLNVNKLTITARATSTLCELCSDSETEIISKFYCIECDQHICDRCVAAHKKIKATQFHQVECKSKENVSESCQKNCEADMSGAEEEIKRDGLSYCEQHPAEQIRLYCYDCHMIMCHYCHLSKHKQHKLSDVTESAKQFRKQLKCDIKHMSAGTCRKRQQIIELETDIKSFQEQVATTQQEIARNYDQMMCLVQSQKCQLMEELNQFKNNILKKFEAEKVEKERNFMIAENFERYCLEMMNNGTACDVSRAAHGLHARAVELWKTQDKPDGHKLSRIRITFTPAQLPSSVNNLLGQLVLEDETVSTLTKEACDRKISLKSFLVKPKLFHVKPTNGRTITGLTVLDKMVFVVRGTEHVNVYKAVDFTSVRNFIILGSNELRRLVSCSHYNCLYVSDDGRQVIYKYDLGNKVTTKWLVRGYCYALSLTKCYNVLVTVHDTPCIKEYSTDGSLVREICLDGSIDCPQHCIELSNGNYVVSHYGQFLSRVCIVDRSGHIIRFYGGIRGSDVGQMNYPRRLCVDTHGNVLVADKSNNRIQLLSPTLTYLGDIEIPGHQLSLPYTLYFDEENHCLYIGEDKFGCMFVLHVDKIENH